jgi:hypothetical protein
MRRTARAALGGWCYHFLNRGNGRAEVSHKEEDFQAFLSLLASACERLAMRVLGVPDAQSRPLTANAPPKSRIPHSSMHRLIVCYVWRHTDVWSPQRSKCKSLP